MWSEMGQQNVQAEEVYCNCNVNVVNSNSVAEINEYMIKT